MADIDRIADKRRSPRKAASARGHAQSPHDAPSPVGCGNGRPQTVHHGGMKNVISAQHARADRSATGMRGSLTQEQRRWFLSWFFGAAKDGLFEVVLVSVGGSAISAFLIAGHYMPVGMQLAVAP